MRRGWLLFSLAALSQLGSGCNGSGTTNPPHTDIVAVQIDPAGANLQLDTAPRQLRAKALDAANNELSNRSFAWSSSSPAVAFISGAVNGMGAIVAGGAWMLRRLQTGSVRAYAASLFLGVVTILGYYLWR